LRSVAVLVGDDQLHVAAPAQGTIAREAGDCGEIVRLLPEALRVEARDRRVDDVWRIEALESGTRRLLDACRLVFEPRLVRRHLARLRRARLAAELQQRLPPEPGELVVVPHRDERPAGTRV